MCIWRVPSWYISIFSCRLFRNGAHRNVVWNLHNCSKGSPWWLAQLSYTVRMSPWTLQSGEGKVSDMQGCYCTDNEEGFNHNMSRFCALRWDMLFLFVFKSNRRWRKVDRHIFRQEQATAPWKETPITILFWTETSVSHGKRTAMLTSSLPSPQLPPRERWKVKAIAVVAIMSCT